MNIIYKNKLKSLVMATALLLTSVSCDDPWIDQDLNIDKDSPSDVPMNLLLPAIQQSMGYNLLGNNSVRTNNIWMQHFDGVDRQSFTEARYQHTPADVNNLWVSMYTEMLMNSKILTEKALVEGAESPNFAGVAQVLTATTLGVGTNLFGDMPYSEALNGGSNILKPSYDTQESIFQAINTLLDNAIVNLGETSNAIEVSGDVVYDGDVDKWIKAANSLKARYAIHLSGVNGNAAYTAALTALANGFESNDDDFLVPFEEANPNPIFQFMEQRTDIRMGATFVDMLIDADDPRLPFYVAENGDDAYVGSIPGSENSAASYPGPNIAGKSAAVKLMTYSELKFIEAEALLQLGQPGAQAAYEEAVAASILRVTGEANTEWLDANIIGDPVSLEKIITQKYIDGVGTNQPYNDYRRTGFPTLTVSQGAVLSEIPTRFPYPQSEINYNLDNLPAFTISDKLWWDIN